jgi:hypothetical protein
MNISTRTLARIAGTLAALVVVAPAAHAGHAQPLKRGLADFGVTARQAAQDRPPATLKRGCTDFGLVFDYSNGCVSPRAAQAAVAARASEHSRPATVKRGCSDFGLVWDYRYGCVAPQAVQASAAASGFDWRDAGIGAGAMLGIVLIVAGLGAAVVARAQHRQATSA